MDDEHQLRRVWNARHIGRGALGSAALIAFAGQQPPIPQHQHPKGIDEGQGAGLFREGVGAQTVRLQILVVELQREAGA